MSREEEERASRREVKLIWERYYKNELEPELKKVKKGNNSERLLEVVSRVERHFEPLIKTCKGNAAKAQIFLVLGDLERYRLKYGEVKTALVRAHNYYLRALVLDPQEGRTYGMLATLATMEGESPAAVHWCARSEWVQHKWPGSIPLFSSAAERTKRKLSGSEWCLAAIYIACKTKISQTGGLRLTIQRLGDDAIDKEDLNTLDRISKLRATITLCMALDAADDEGFTVRKQIAHLIGAWAKACLTPDENSSSAALFLARFLIQRANTSSFIADTEKNDEQKLSFEECADALSNYYIYALKKSKHQSGEERSIFLDDEAYMVGILDKTNQQSTADAQHEDNLEQRLFLFRNICLELSKRSLLTIKTTAPRRTREKKKKKNQDEEPLEVPSGASSSEDEDNTISIQQLQPIKDQVPIALPSAAARWLRTPQTPTSPKTAPILTPKLSPKSHVSQDNIKQKPIVIDGANVAMRYGQGKQFSTNGIRICLNFFQDKCPDATLAIILPEYVLDSNKVSAKKRSGRYTKAQEVPDNVEYLKTLQAQGIVHITPAQDYDDSYQIEYARRHHGIIVSNDLFRDAIKKLSPLVQHEFASWLQSHLVSYTFIGDDFIPNPDFNFQQILSNGSVDTPPQTSLSSPTLYLQQQHAAANSSPK